MKYKYNLSNLDCANCARKIEESLNNNKEIKNARVNFNTLKLSFETDNKKPLELVKKIINKIEPEVNIYENETKQTSSKFQIIRLFIGIILALIGVYTKLPFNLNFIVTIVAYIILLSRTIKNAFNLIIKSKTINENFLITISCIGAYLVGEHMEGLMVIILYEIGKILEDKAVNKSRKSIKELMDIKPEYANIKVKDEYKKVSPETINIGDIIIVKNGEKIPLDGIIVNGNTTLNVTALTGESNPISVNVNDSVLSGSINIDSIIEIKVTEKYENSTVNKILELVENATDKKAKTENFVAKLARIYTPIVLTLAILTVLLFPLLFNITFKESIYKALIFLVISCPCAIAISVPLSYFSGIGKCSKTGILIKGSDYLDILKNLKEIIFDKTGTLTNGEFKINEINSFNKNYTKKEILDMIAKGESFSNHPIAKAILKEIDYELDIKEIKNYKEKAGYGISYKYQNNNYLIGNSEFVKYAGKIDKVGTTIFIKLNDEIIGNIILKDSLKTNAFNVIKKLKEKNINVRMFTGDNEIHAREIAKKLKIDYESEMLPTDKYKALEIIQNKKINQNDKIAFVGDGINDSPVLALSDIGISMGGVGSNAAIEASDIVIMNDDLDKINIAINISKKTNHIIKQNLTFAISTKIIILLLSMLGFAGMWQAIFADVGVTLITILNTLRILK